MHLGRERPRSGAAERVGGPMPGAGVAGGQFLGDGEAVGDDAPSGVTSVGTVRAGR
jgi:hypothetical protein